MIYDLEKALVNRQYKSEKDFFDNLFENEGRNYTESLDNIHFFEQDKFLNIIKEAKENYLKVAIVGDYDCDGITASTILARVLSYLKINFTTILPNRFKDGYGLSPKLVDRAKSENAHIIITVDNGIVAFDSIDYAKKLGFKVIVTDHHTPLKDLPNADLIINPQLKKDNIKAENISGAFTICVLCNHVIKNMCQDNFSRQRLIYEIFELAGISTFADQMNLTYENYKISKWLLSRMRNNHFVNLGINLLAQSNFSNLLKADEDMLNFNIIPVINATGRMSDATLSYNLLMTKEAGITTAKQIKEILLENDLRKTLSRKYADILLKNLDRNVSINVCEVIADKSDEKIDLSGIIGIIASNIVENTNKPTFVFYKNKSGILHGSGRSIPGFDLFKFINSKKNDFRALKMGGHSGAMGIAFDCDEKLDEFSKVVNSEKIEFEESEEFFIRLTNRFDLDEINKLLNSYAPFGQGFEKPDFVLRSEIVEPYLFSYKHISFKIQNGNKVYPCMYFFNNEIEKVKESGKFDIYFSLCTNNNNVQLNVKKIEKIM